MFQLHPHTSRPGPYVKRAQAVLGPASATGVDATTTALRGACEASRERLGLAPYPEQVAAALALMEGRAVEMQTGEGKTLALFLAASALARAGRHVMVLTANDYLSARDAEQLRPAYTALGIRVGTSLPQTSDDEKQRAYASGVVYVSLREAAFDWMRDGLRRRPWMLAQRQHDVALIDELDAALIDHATVPFTIGRAGEAPDEPLLIAVDDAVTGLMPERDYQREGGATALTDAGWQRVEKALRRAGRLGEDEPLFARADGELEHCTLNALMAHTVLERDRDYVVDGERVMLLDSVTGRIASGRRWGQGLQQAVERKERLPASAQPVTRASTTAAAFVGQFRSCAGTSGTLATCAEELHQRFGMQTVVIPPHRPSARVDQPDRRFESHAAREQALVETLGAQQRAGRPVLVGTWSIADASALSRRLTRAGLAHVTLTAHDEAAEAALIAEAAVPGRITVATQLAGRGTDIQLGGGVGEDGAEQRASVIEAGGLLLILCGRGSSKRHDDQWRGRAGRRGEPGETQAWVADDDLLASTAEGLSIDRAQARGESQRQLARRLRHELDAVIEVQRRGFATLRDEVLWGVSASESSACAAWWRAADGAPDAPFAPADPVDAWWSSAIDAGVTLRARARSAEGPYSIREFCIDTLAEYGVALRVRDVGDAPRPFRLGAELVRLGMLRHAARARVAIAHAVEGERRDARGGGDASEGHAEPNERESPDDHARRWLDERFRASKPRHVVRLARLLTLVAYDDAWSSFMAQVPLLMDRAKVERMGRATPVQTLQQLAHAALQQELHAASCHVGRTLLASGARITREHADMAGLRWVQGRVSSPPVT